MTSKQILMTGGTGFLGQALIKHWLSQGHQLTILSRSPATARLKLPHNLKVIGQLQELPSSSQFTAVVNLAGAPIFSKHWTTAQKQLLRDSRIGLTAQLVSFMAGLETKPAVLISGSAIGVYGDEHHPRPLFSQQLCLDWEQQALNAEALGIRVCLIRTGLVLGEHGGLLKNMLPAFKMGLGGKLGNGQQWMSWIHVTDWVAIVAELLNNPQRHGAVNATAPTPVTNQEFSATLAQILNRPCLLPLPAGVLKLLLGEMSELLLGSQCVYPHDLTSSGFQFQYPTLLSALSAILSKS